MDNNLAKFEKSGMTELFENKEFGKLSVIIEYDNDGEVKDYWFIANEVCNILGYNNPWDALARHVDEDDKKVMPSLTSENTRLEIPNRGINVINESGLYSLILRSRKKKAKQFKKWVTSEVLPSIRKQGYYVDKERMEYLEKVNEQYQQMTNSSGLFSVTTIAKAYGLSGVKLNQLLNDWKIQYKQNNTWTLYTDYSDKGYTAIRTHTHLNHDDECWYTTALTYWTQKGRLFINEQLEKHGYCMV